MLMHLLTSVAHAFCGFYVGGAGAELYNDATVVVMMRDGSRTVLSMQNSYEGPASDFAMVVPVPEVLDEDDVRTLPDAVFDRIDKLAAPRRVEYWERDPCQPYAYEERMALESAVQGPPSMKRAPASSPDLGVTVEAQFDVAEYEIVILSAKDSAGLDTWLRNNRYNIPDGAESVLRGYVQQGTKFFVAKVDPEKVRFEGDRAVLSPLRMAYDDKRFQLPVRLGLLNSRGEQDLLVHILGRDQRYEVANYPNTTVPTNLRVDDAVRDNFGGFYDALLTHTFRQHPRAVVTEYSWQSGSCDPCPGPTLTAADIATLGGDRLGNRSPMSWTLTRLHARYTQDTLGEDLVFEPARGLIGGRGTPDAEGRLQEATQASSTNQFQGRYVILHRWEGDIACEQPQRGVWGGPPSTSSESPTTRAVEGRLEGGAPEPVRDLAALIEDELPGLKAKPAADPSLIPELGE